jgi:NADH dehydrogenase
MKIAMTGATGFVGRRIVRRLEERGHQVRALVRDPDRLPPELRKADLTRGDLRDETALRRVVAGVDAVIHLVGIIVERGPDTFDAVHVEGTRRLMAATAEAGCRRIVHMSAVGARDEPGATPYHRTKARGETVVRQSGIPAAVFRPSIIVGPGNAPVRTLARLHRWSPVIPVFGRGDFPIQPVWVEDVALAFALAAERRELTGAFELGGPEIVTYEDFVRAIGRASGHPRPVVHVPLSLVRFAARTFDVLGEYAPITTDQLEMLLAGSATPNNAIEKVFGVRPARLERALEFLGPPKKPNPGPN